MLSKLAKNSCRSACRMIKPLPKINYLASSGISTSKTNYNKKLGIGEASDVLLQKISNISQLVLLAASNCSRTTSRSSEL